MSTKILHCITSLYRDGAQQMLKRLVGGLDRQRYEHVVVSLRERLPMADELEELGARVICLNMSRGVPSLSALMALRKIITDEKPALINSWLYHANCATALAMIGIKNRMPLVWSIRGSLDGGWDRGIVTGLVIKFSAKLSPIPNAITFNSRTSIEQHRSAGYRCDDMRYLPNGFDTTMLALSNSREEIRKQLGIPSDRLLVGIAGRYDRTKDYPNFLRAFELVSKQFPQAHALLIGRDIEETNEELNKLIKGLGIESIVTRLPRQRNLAPYFSTLDVYCSSSITEGFPNVVAEALACQIPCVVTDVGMARSLVNGSGVCVPPSNSIALSQGIAELLALTPEDRQALGIKGREHICAEYQLDKVVAQFDDMYKEFSCCQEVVR